MPQHATAEEGGLLVSLAQALAPRTGQDFLGALVQNLAQLIQVRTVFIGECVGAARERVRMLAIWSAGAPAENVEYPLHGSPCANIFELGAPYHCESGLADRYPAEKGIADSYYGEPIYGRTGREVLGHIALLDDRPMGRDRIEQALIQVFAARAGAEIERLRAETALRADLAGVAHANRLSAMSEMVASLAHELKQPLTSTLSFAQACARGLRDGTLSEQEVSAAMDRIVANVGMANRIIAQLRDFLRKEEPQYTAEPLMALVTDALELVRHDLVSRNVAAVFDAEAAPIVRGNRVQIQQILVNLLRNAAEALEGRPLGDGRIRLHLGLAAGFARLGIADNGPGVDPGVRDQLFEPFVSTKSGGMGVGLAISRTIAEQHGGMLLYRDPPEGGAEFVVALPAERGS